MHPVSSAVLSAFAHAILALDTSEPSVAEFVLAVSEDFALCRCMLTRMNGPEEVSCTQQAVASSHLTAPSMSMQRTSGMSSQCQCPAAKPAWLRAHDMHCAVQECNFSKFHLRVLSVAAESLWGSFHVSDNK